MSKIEVKYYSDEIAESVRNIDKAVKQMISSGLNERALIALIKDYNSRLTKDEIRAVLNALKGLKSYYLEDK